MNWFKICITIGFLSFSMITHSQISQTVISSADSVKTDAIPFEEIPAISLQITIKPDKLKESLISEDQIAAKNAKSDSILSDIKTLPIREEKVNLMDYYPETCI